MTTVLLSTYVIVGGTPTTLLLLSMIVTGGKTLLSDGCGVNGLRRWFFDCDAAIACNVVTVGDADDDSDSSASLDEFDANVVDANDDDDNVSSTGCHMTPFDV